MIPKIIHQFSSDSNDVNSLIRSIKNSNPSWKHKIWTLDSVKKCYEDAPNDFKLKFDYFVDRNMHEDAKDIAKFWILYKEGGMFVDNEHYFKEGKNFESLEILNYDLVLFNGTLNQNSWRLQETLMGCIPMHPFFGNLLRYINNPNYFLKSEWDFSPLEIYASSYITTHYLLYTQLMNGEEFIREAVNEIKNTNLINIQPKEIILPTSLTFVNSKHAILEHRRKSKFVL